MAAVCSVWTFFHGVSNVSSRASRARPAPSASLLPASKWSNFRGLVLGCINADCCIKVRIFQHFRDLQNFLCTIPVCFDFSWFLDIFLQNSAPVALCIFFAGDSRFIIFSWDFHENVRVSVILILMVLMVMMVVVVVVVMMMMMMMMLLLRLQ